MKETIRIELTQGQHDALRAIGITDCEIKTIGCTMSIGGPSSDHHMTVGIKTRATGGNHTIDNIDTTPIQVESLTGGTEWNGEGLPPVGVECEVYGALGKYNEWHKCRVFAYEHGITFISDDKTWRGISKGEFEFRKLETEAERNKRERNDLVNDICEQLFGDMAEQCRPDVVGTIHAMLDAGFTKAVTNE
ncbi:hypothetical protein NTE11_003098 [Vibrio fluvialis]|nr:hypothetical protein [Vibrio fluvialis]EKO3461195.1 hypothetical protein [Vibrio fluvialis]